MPPSWSARRPRAIMEMARAPSAAPRRPPRAWSRLNRSPPSQSSMRSTTRAPRPASSKTRSTRQTLAQTQRSLASFMMRASRAARRRSPLEPCFMIFPARTRPALRSRTT